MERYLDGRIAIVTGAAQGIGFAVAHRLARAGALVAVADVNVIRAAEAAGRIAGDGLRALPIGVDVSDEAAVGAMIVTVHRGGGRGADRLARWRRVHVHDRPVHRYQQRSSNVLGGVLVRATSGRCRLPDREQSWKGSGS